MPPLICSSSPECFIRQLWFGLREREVIFCCISKLFHDQKLKISVPLQMLMGLLSDLKKLPCLYIKMVKH